MVIVLRIFEIIVSCRVERFFSSYVVALSIFKTCAKSRAKNLKVKKPVVCANEISVDNFLPESRMMFPLNF